MRIFLKIILSSFVLLILLACSSQKEPEPISIKFVNNSSHQLHISPTVEQGWEAFVLEIEESKTIEIYGQTLGFLCAEHELIKVLSHPNNTIVFMDKD